MTKNIAVNGILGGIVAASVMGMMVFYMKANPGSAPNAFLGFIGMLLAFIFLVWGIKAEAESNNGIISYKKAFLSGTLIAFIIATIYVVSWLVIYYNFFPDFIDRYSEMVLKNNGTLEKVSEMNQMKEWYKNPLMVILLTYMEIFPLGIFISLVASFFLKNNKQD